MPLIDANAEIEQRSAAKRRTDASLQKVILESPGHNFPLVDFFADFAQALME
jgi:hypothetical protein